MWRRWVVMIVVPQFAILANCGSDEEDPPPPLNQCGWTCLASPADPNNCNCHRTWAADGGCSETPDNPSFEIVDSCPTEECCITYREPEGGGADVADQCDCSPYPPASCQATLNNMHEDGLTASIVSSCPPP